MFTLTARYRPSYLSVSLLKLRSLMNSSYYWTRQQVLVLVEGIQQHPNVYNPLHPLYKNRVKRYDALQQVATKVSEIRPGTTVEDVKSKWNKLRTTFSAETKKVERSKMSTSLPDMVYQPSLFYFESMSFLRDHLSLACRVSSGASDSLSSTLSPQEKVEELEEELPLEMVFLGGEQVGEELVLGAEEAAASPDPPPRVSPDPPPRVSVVSPPRVSAVPPPRVSAVPPPRVTSAPPPRRPLARRRPYRHLAHVLPSTLSDILEDSDTLFGKSVVARLKELSPDERHEAKFQIDTLLYNIVKNRAKT